MRIARRATEGRRWFLAIAILGLCVTNATSASDTTDAAWKYDPPHDIEWYFTAPEVLVVATDRQVRCLSQEDGAERWHLDIEECSPDRVEPIPYTQLALISFPEGVGPTSPMVALVDLTTGEEWWTSERYNLARSYGSFLVPHKDALLIYGQRPSGSDVLLLVDIATGVPSWSVEVPFSDWPPDLFGEGAQPPLFDSEDTMILFLNGHAIRKYDLEKGRLIWEAQDLKSADRASSTGEVKSEHEPAPLLAAGYAPMVLAADGKRFFAPHHDTVGAFSTYNGSRRWAGPARLDGIAAQMEPVPQGLLVRTIPENPDASDLHSLCLIDIRAGRQLWCNTRSGDPLFKQIFGTWLSSTPFLVENNRVVVAADGKLLGFSLATGQEEKVCNLDFDGVDDAFSLEFRNGEFVVAGEQNVVWCDPDGNVTRRVYYDPPDGFDKGIALLASAALLNAIGEIHMGRVTISMHGNYGPGLEEMLRDYTATVEGTDFVYMLAESDDGPQIVRVSKDDGREYGRIAVGTRNPEYFICPYTGNLLWRSSKRSMSCFVFQ